MTEDIAQLGLSVSSDSVPTATGRLRAMQEQTKLVDAAVGKLIGTVGKLVGAYATWQVAEAVVRKFVSSTIEADRVQAQLIATIKSTGGVAGQTIQALNDHSAALKRMTAFDDEAIGSAQTLLLTFTRLRGDVFPRATEAVLDLATKMGGDLQGAAIQLGKALNDPVAGLTALQRVGVTFDASQRQSIKTMVEANDVVGAQSLILKELQTEFGGAAKAARGTLGGALMSLQNAFDDLFESTGPAADHLRGAVEGLIDRISDPGFIQSVQNFGAALFDAMSAVLPAIREILDFMSKLGATSDKFAGVPTAQIEKDAEEYRKMLSNGSTLGNRDGTIKNLNDAGAEIERRRLAQMHPEATGTGPTNFNFRDVLDAKASPGAYAPSLTADQITAQEKAAKSYEKLILGAQQYSEKLKLQGESQSMTSYEAERLTHQQDLLNQAANDNIKLSPDMRAQIDAVAASMANAEVLAGITMNLADASPWETMSKQIDELDAKLAAHTITVRTHTIEVGKEVEKMVGQYANAANDVIGSLEAITNAIGGQGKEAFEIHKALSIARAVVSGGEAIVHSYNAGAALPGGPITGAVFAGLAAAATAAQIAAIASTSYQSKSLSGSGAAGGSAPSVAAAAPQQSQAINLTIRGSGSVNVDDFIDQFTEQIADGGHGAFIKVIKAA
jgi:hypothetical protein